MSDEDWLRAIARHNSDQTSWVGDTAIRRGRRTGTAARTTRRRGSGTLRAAGPAVRCQHPAGLLLRLIETVAGRIPIALLSQLCQHAYDIAGRSVAVRSASRSPRHAETSTTRWSRCSRNAPPTQTPTASSLVPPPARGDSIFGGRPAGRRTELDSRFGCPGYRRCAVPRARTHTDRFLEPLAALATDPILAVRAQAAEALRALMNHRPELALDLAEALLTGADSDLLGTRTVTDAAHLRTGAPARQVRSASATGSRQPDAVAEHAGQAWAVGYLRRDHPGRRCQAESQT